MSARTWVLFAALLGAPLAAQGSDLDRANLDLGEIRRLPVLSGTRFQPLESYAREVVLRITGEVEAKRAPDGTPIGRGSASDRKRGDPVLTYLEWWLLPESARTIPWVFIERPGARKLLGFPADQKDFERVSYDELMAGTFLANAEELAKRSRDTFTLDEAEIEAVYGRVKRFAAEAGLLPEQSKLPEELRGGPRILPPHHGMKARELYSWEPLGALAAKSADYDYSEDQLRAVADAFTRLRDAFRKADRTAFTASAAALRIAISALGSAEYPVLATMDREVSYDRGHYFDRASWWYLTTSILAIFALIWRNRIFWIVAMLPGLYGLALNAYGMAERTALSKTALLTNLYETLLYVSGVAFLVALVCEGFFRSRWFLLLGSLLAMFCLRVAEDHALVMQPQITTLKPVLDKNFWIHIHVPTIVASYAPLSLAALMGNVFLLLSLFLRPRSDTLKEVGRIQYWAMIPGVILLFAGLILGGIWADYAWGRFWGWDPKETWGLVTWIAFVVVIHGRWTGWLKNYGTAVGTIIGGACMIMTYWGVSFMLSGKHSYASANDGSAGLSWWRRIPTWIWSYAAFEVALVTLAAVFRRNALPGEAEADGAGGRSDGAHDGVVEGAAPLPAAKS